MANLAEELRRVADQAALDARPLPVAAVMAVGDRRRRRRWSRNVLAAAVAAGTAVTIAVVASTNALGRPSGPGPAAGLGGCTERVTLAAADGHISGCVSYRYGSHGLTVRSVEASYAAEAGFALPYFTFTFLNPATETVDYQFSTALVEGNAILSHNTGPILLGRRPQMRAVHRGDVLEITLKYEDANSGGINTAATLSLSLTPRGLYCPNLGQDYFGSSKIPTC